MRWGRLFFGMVGLAACSLAAMAQRPPAEAQPRPKPARPEPALQNPLTRGLWEAYNDPEAAKHDDRPAAQRDAERRAVRETLETGDRILTDAKRRNRAALERLKAGISGPTSRTGRSKQ
jgi:hypothetical protein